MKRARTSKIESWEAIKRWRIAFILSALCLAAFAGGSARGLEDPPPAPPEEKAAAGEKDDGPPPAPVKVDMKATDIGVRFTPRMAEAVGKAFTKQMKRRYDFDDKQVRDVEGILQKRLMKFAQENASLSRDLIERVMETAIENEGPFFNKESAIEFAQMTKKLTPELKKFFADTSADIGRTMTMKQRLKLTGDMAGVTAGLAIFESRMKKWEDGKVGDRANPFWEAPEDREDKKAETPEDPNESTEHKQARQEIERWITWQIDMDKQWEWYVNQAIEYYDFNEKQTSSAKAILKECQERAAAIKTPTMREAAKTNRIAQRLTWSAGGGQYNQGPWMHKLESDYERLLKPMKDLDQELKNRIESLPDSGQRAKAETEIRKKLGDKGMKQLPA